MSVADDPSPTPVPSAEDREVARVRRKAIIAIEIAVLAVAVMGVVGYLRSPSLRGAQAAAEDASLYYHCRVLGLTGGECMFINNDPFFSDSLCLDVHIKPNKRSKLYEKELARDHQKSIAFAGEVCSQLLGSAADRVVWFQWDDGVDWSQCEPIDDQKTCETFVKIKGGK